VIWEILSSVRLLWVGLASIDRVETVKVGGPGGCKIIISEKIPPKKGPGLHFDNPL